MINLRINKQLTNTTFYELLREVSVHWKDWCCSWNSSTLATSCKELTHWKTPWCWEGLGAGGEGNDRGWDGWMASPTRWTWVWIKSRSWWWTGRPGVPRFVGSQRVGHDWATELNWTEQKGSEIQFCWPLTLCNLYLLKKLSAILRIIYYFNIFQMNEPWTKELSDMPRSSAIKWQVGLNCLTPHRKSHLLICNKWRKGRGETKFGDAPWLWVSVIIQTIAFFK